MTAPLLPHGTNDHPEVRTTTSGEGAQTALAAMIRKRKMGENHVEPDAPESLPRELGPEC